MAALEREEEEQQQEKKQEEEGMGESARGGQRSLLEMLKKGGESGEWAMMKEVDLSSSSLNFSDVRLVANFLLKRPNRVSSLRLSDNLLGDEGSELLGILLDELDISVLDISNNEFTTRGLRAIARQACKLESLSVGGNDLSDAGEELVELIRRNKNLRHLDMSNIGLDAPDVKRIAEAVRDASSLSSLVLDDNDCAAAMELLGGCESLTYLSIRNAGLDDASCLLLCRQIAMGGRRTLKLDCRGNRMCTDKSRSVMMGTEKLVKGFEFKI